MTTISKYMIYGTLVVLTAIAVLFSILITFRAESQRSCFVPILMYHDVGETANSPWCVPIEIFRSQMTFLHEQGFKTILPSDIASNRQWSKPLPRKPVIITFDDGYLSTLTIIEPMLKENGFRAIAYLITGQVVETAADRREYEGKKCLVWPEVVAMQKRGTFVFGGHSQSHGNLAVSGEPLHDLTECLKQLKLHGIRKPYSFCYPYGQYNQDTINAVKQAGFQTAVVCEDAVASIGPVTNLFALPRVSVMGGSHNFKLLTRLFHNEKIIYEISALATNRCSQSFGAVHIAPCSRLPLRCAERLILSKPSIYWAHRSPLGGYFMNPHEISGINKKADVKEKSLIYRVLHTGIPLEISACLRGNGDEKDIWLPAREISRGEFELQFMLPDADMANTQKKLEIWDKYRLFKLATINP